LQIRDYAYENFDLPLFLLSQLYTFRKFW